MTSFCVNEVYSINLFGNNVAAYCVKILSCGWGPQYIIMYAQNKLFAICEDCLNPIRFEGIITDTVMMPKADKTIWKCINEPSYPIAKIHIEY